MSVFNRANPPNFQVPLFPNRNISFSVMTKMFYYNTKITLRKYLYQKLGRFGNYAVIRNICNKRSDEDQQFRLFLICNIYKELNLSFAYKKLLNGK